MGIDGVILSFVKGHGAYGIALYLLITLSIAAILSLMIGLQRELNGEPAGLSTHILISVGSSLVMTLSIWAIRAADGSLDLISGEIIDASVNYDTSRIAAAVISGIGFIGAGAIVKTGFNVKGLSTAATLWISAAIGLACGSGFIVEACITAAVTMIILLFSSAIKRGIDRRLPQLTIMPKGATPLIGTVNELAKQNGMVVREIKEADGEDQSDGHLIKVLFSFNTSIVVLRDVAYSLLWDGHVQYVECSSSKYQERYESDQIQTGASSGGQPAGEAEDAQDGDSNGDSSEN